MTTTITFSRSQALALLAWIDQNISSNWGGWGKYPSLPVGASYLQYDSNRLQINLAEEIELDGNYYNCVTDGRPVGGKWDSPLSTFELKEAYNITDEEVKEAIASQADNERKQRVSKWLAHAKEMLLNDCYAPFIQAVEAIYLKSERAANENYMAPLGNVRVGETVMHFDTVVEWVFVRKQGKNGPNKKNVYAAVIPGGIQNQLNEQLEKEISRRQQQLHDEVAKYETELNSL